MSQEARPRWVVLVMWRAATLVFLAHASVAFYARHDRGDAGPLGGFRSDNWELPVGRFVAVIGFGIVVATGIVASRNVRSLGGHPRQVRANRVLTWVTIALAVLPLTVGPLALGFPWWDIRSADSSHGLISIALVDVATALITIYLAWIWSLEPARGSSTARSLAN